jgi:hypothetical protein
MAHQGEPLRLREGQSGLRFSRNAAMPSRKSSVLRSSALMLKRHAESIPSHQTMYLVDFVVQHSYRVCVSQIVGGAI